MLSAGDGKYINVKPYHQLPPLVFAVERNLSKRSLSIKIVSDELKRVLTQCLRQRLAPPINPKLDLDTLLRSYDTLKLKLQLANATEPQNEGVKELALLLDGFLLDRTVYDGIGLNSFKNRGVLTMSFLQDLHRRTAHRGLRDIGECLVLGKISDEEVGARLNDIRDKIAYFTQTGDFNNLQVLCEASVMAGEVDILYNQAILRKALDNNHYDIYEYLLDLMARSQNSPTDTPQSNLPDITYDPMYNAIRLGHLSTVENLVTEGTFFEGFAPGEGIPDGHILAPLSAAVLWHQTEIVQCLIKSLLKTGLLYYAGYHQAMEWARTPEMKELLRTIPDQDQLYDIRGPLRSLMLNTPEASKHRSPAPTPDLLPHLGHRQTEQAINSVSALSAGLANIATAPFELSYEFCPGLCVDSYSEIDAWRQERPADHIPPYSPPSSQSPLASPQATECPPPCLDDLREDGSREFVLITKSYTNRRKMGCSVLQNLGTQGLKVLRNMSDRDTFDTTGFSDVDTLWREGLQGWELLLTNVPLPNLTQVLQCLLVADALANYMTLQGQESLLQYVPILASSLYVSDNKPRSLVDASMWREILPKTDQGLFAEIIASTWEENNCEFPCTTWDQETDYIRPLMQCIVGVDHVSHQPAGLASTGRRLPALTEIDWKTSNCHDEATAHHNFRYIDSRLCRLSIDEDDSQVDLFGLKDLIDIDKLQQDMLFERPRIYGAFIRGLPPTAQINVHSAVAQALSSAAFSWVLAMILGIPKSHFMTSKPQLTGHSAQWATQRKDPKCRDYGATPWMSRRISRDVSRYGRVSGSSAVTTAARAALRGGGQQFWVSPLAHGGGVRLEDEGRPRFGRRSVARRLL